MGRVLLLAFAAVDIGPDLSWIDIDIYGLLAYLLNSLLIDYKFLIWLLLRIPLNYKRLVAILFHKISLRFTWPSLLETFFLNFQFIRISCSLFVLKR